MIEGTLIGQDSDAFMALLELGEAESRLQNAINDPTAEVAILPNEDTFVYSSNGIIERTGVDKASVVNRVAGIGRQQPVEKSVPVYRGLEGAGHDPYCADPYLDPYNP